jgi:YHS domain-containing protein
MMMSRVIAIVTVAVVSFGVLLSSPSFAKQPVIYTSSKEKIAIGGYDAVSYFTAVQPVPGTVAFSLVHEGATWLFADGANRAAFQANPEKYVPQYGGYCAWAVSEGYTAPGDPKVFKVVGGRLYLNYNRSVATNWEKHTTRNISRGDANWPKVLQK